MTKTLFGQRGARSRRPLASKALTWLVAPATLLGTGLALTVPPASAASVHAASAAPAASVYTALGSSTRICDTRGASTSSPTNQCSGMTLPAGGTRDVALPAGASGIPASATAVVANVTVTNTKAQGFLNVYPTGAPSTTSIIDYTAGQTVANLATVQVGSTTTTGTAPVTTPSITIQNGPTNGNGGTADVVVDLEGYYAPPASVTALTGEYHPLTAARVADTRCSPSAPSFCGAENISAPNQMATTLTAGGTQNIQVTGVGGVPSTGVADVVLNVTETHATAPSFFTVSTTPGTPPAMSSAPTVSNENFAAGETLAAKVIVPVGANGDVTIFNHAGTADAVVDVDGYFSDSTTAATPGSLFTPVAPTRVIGAQGGGVTVAGGDSAFATVTGTNGVPAGATAAALDVIDIQPAQGNFLTVYPSDMHPPVTSDVNWIPANTYNVVPNAAYGTLSTTAGTANGTTPVPAGSFSVLNGPVGTGSTSVDADLFGYFAPANNSVAVTATPNTVPHGGATTSTVTATVTAPAGGSNTNDTVTFTVTGTGCGTVNPTTGSTGPSGTTVKTTYTAGMTAGTCTVTATESITGQSGSTTITQS